MKIILLIITSFLIQDNFIETLNKLPRENIYCRDDNKIELWSIDLASPMTVDFTKCELINSDKSIYKIKGIIKDKNNEQPLEDVNIYYYSIDDNYCTLEVSKKSNTKGQFIMEIKIK